MSTLTALITIHPDHSVVVTGENIAPRRTEHKTDRAAKLRATRIEKGLLEEGITAVVENATATADSALLGDLVALALDDRLTHGARAHAAGLVVDALAGVDLGGAAGLIRDLPMVAGMDGAEVALLHGFIKDELEPELLELEVAL